MAKNKKLPDFIASSNPAAAGRPFLANTIINWLGALCVLVALAFFLHTQDSAQVKITLLRAGACGAFALWACWLLVNRVNIFTKNNFKKLLPFLAFFIYIFLSYLLTAHFWARGANFVYFLSCAAVFIVAACLCDARALQKISSFIFAACWAAFAYGILQAVGADFLFGSDFFGKRVFSTFANPNFFADFCLFSTIIITARFLHTRNKKLLALLALGLINLFLTESKGAWLALGVSAAAFALVYLNYFTPLLKKNKLKITAAALGALLLLCGLSVYYGVKRPRSVNFRVYTWGAALEMAAKKPVFGYGAGSFFIEYPAFKKPQIFYIETIHNAQTTHAENYYIELLATLGITGFALFAWCAFYLCAGVYKKLKNYSFNTADERAKQHAFMLLAYALALASIFIHNFVDISLFLPSGGYFAALLAGGVFNLTYGPLEAAPAQGEEGKSGAFFYILAAAACALFAVTAALVLKDFAFITQGGFTARPANALINWAALIFCFGAVCFIFAKVIFRYKKTAPVFVLGAAAVLMYFAWTGMTAGNYIWHAGALAERGHLDAAIAAYTRAIRYDRFNPGIYQFRALTFTARMDTARANMPSAGDGPGQTFNDYERAQKDFERVEALNPGEPLLYYNWGTMRLEAAKKLPQQAPALHAQARANFLKALEFDPVFENIYFQLVNIEMAQNNPRAAYEWLQKYQRGPAGVEEIYLHQHQNNARANAYLSALRAQLGE